MRALVGSVGYFNLSDLSAGLMVIDRLRSLESPDGVELCDLSYGGPIAMVHRLSEASPAYDRLVLVGASEERMPEGFRWTRWEGKLPDASDIQARVAEAVTGVIDLWSFPIIGQQFDALPDNVFVIEIGAERLEAGLEASPAVAGRLDTVGRLAVELALGTLPATNVEARHVGG